MALCANFYEKCDKDVMCAVEKVKIQRRGNLGRKGACFL